MQKAALLLLFPHRIHDRRHRQSDETKSSKELIDTIAVSVRELDENAKALQSGFCGGR